MIEILEALSRWDDTMIMIVTLVSIAVIFSAVYLYTRSLMISICAIQFVNYYNLTVYLTPWLGLGLKPLYPIWMTIVLLVVPFIYVIVEKELFRDYILHQGLWYNLFKWVDWPKEGIPGKGGRVCLNTVNPTYYNALSYRYCQYCGRIISWVVSLRQSALAHLCWDFPQISLLKSSRIRGGSCPK